SCMGADVKSSRQGVDENLHGVLRAHRAADGRNNGSRDRSMGDRPPPYVAGEKRKRAIAIATNLFHYGRTPSRLRKRFRARRESVQGSCGRFAPAACSARAACLLRTFSTGFVQAVIFAAAPLCLRSVCLLRSFSTAFPQALGAATRPSQSLSIGVVIT